ncbi:hypothetical protein [Frigidibacter oleivorans]|uniref:hypothetical protein n=1 Tax=Frigidibacter oleivorans TaxID=2487129 RepID=UPI000F8F0C57|nr:hypothetical protein [Frigidibacter oleivorans]
MTGFQRRGTRVLKDGRTAFVRLQVDRRLYEFAKAWAAFHAEADPAGTAEEHLEGYLEATLREHMVKTGWSPPAEIKALFPAGLLPGNPQNSLDDGIPF